MAPILHLSFVPCYGRIFDVHLETSELEHGTDLFCKHLEELQPEEPEVIGFHSAFEHYSMNKYSPGSAALNELTASS